MSKVSKSDVIDLCNELGLVKFTDGDEFVMEDELAEAMDSEGNTDFLCRYTQALLRSIQHGVVNLTGKEERYKGFGVRDGSTLTMIVKTEDKFP